MKSSVKSARMVRKKMRRCSVSCAMYFCAGCQRAHKKPRVTAEHEFVSVEKALKEKLNGPVRSILSRKSALTAARISKSSAWNVWLTFTKDTKLTDWSMWCRDSRRKCPSSSRRSVFLSSVFFFHLVLPFYFNLWLNGWGKK